MKTVLAGVGAFGLKHLDAIKTISGVEVASVVGAEMPGRMPLMNPMITPIIINGRVGNENTSANPLPIAPK